MIPRRRVGHRPDHWSSPHERARVRAAERLDAPLRTNEQDWLETHLAECEECRAIAESYAADRLELRSLRDVAPEPRRDLWARTAAGIERESASIRRSAEVAGARRRASLPAWGALSGLAVVVLVVIATAVSGGFLGRVGTDGPGPGASIAAVPTLATQAPTTAIAVVAGAVRWLGSRADGSFAYNVADVDVVCRQDQQPDCAPFEDGHARRVTLTATPRFVFQSPVDNRAVVVGTDAAGADAVLVVVLPTPDPTPEASTGPDATPDPSPSGSPSPTPPIDTPTVAPGDSLPASLASSAEPIASALTSPEPTVSTAIAIITNVTVVGRAAAFSPDGAWFAFSARPADGSAGPDIYVWHIDDLLARPLTTDHASVFASWVGGSLLGSRLIPEPVAEPEDGGAPLDPTPDPAAETLPATETPVATDASLLPGTGPAIELLPATFLLDPLTGAETPLTGSDWQPVVDPTGRAVVAWQGTVGLAADGLTTLPATGNLVVYPFRAPVPSYDPGATPMISTPATPSASPVDASPVDASPSVPVVVTDFPAQVVAVGPIADFDARWDDTGSWLAIWIADPIDSTIGRLSLLRLDPVTGLVDRPEGAPQDVPALPGFSIGLGRLAWVTPPGQGGEGSRIQIVAWTSEEIGAVESVPVEGAIVVQ